MSEPHYPIEALAHGDLFSVPGIRGGASTTGVKPSGLPDLALIVADAPMTSAAMFTKNACAAAPVQVSRARLAASPQTRAIVINSGNANALTGPQGMRDAIAMVETLEAACGGPGLVLSTGIIGVPLPVAPILQGIRETSQTLTRPADQVARAILTTDTRTKTAGAQIQGPDKIWTIGGVAKGSGMIHPNMATMLGVMATDLPMPHEVLQAALVQAVDNSFHQISVDGDTSTNDAVVVLAPQPLDQTPLSPALVHAFNQALQLVARSLAQQIVADGEGATRWMDIQISGARSPQEARRVAAAIAVSPLVKTALAGGNPNWGRILSAAGNAQVPLAPETLTLALGPHTVFKHGAPVPTDEAALESTFSAERVTISLDLGQGPHTGQLTTIDLTHGYIEINAEYTT